MIYWIILAAWIIGMVIAAWRIAKWENDFKISLEREAYDRQYDDDYLSHRHFWAWTKYL